MMRTVFIALMALIPSLADSTPKPMVEPWHDTRPAPRSPELMQKVLLAAHNEARLQYGTTPLAWSDELAVDALAYAKRLAATREFAHDAQRGVYPRQGENLFMGTRDAFTFREMMVPLVNEKQDFKPGRFPDVSRTGDWSDVGHYTQIVWPSTKSVGCAVASNDRDDYLVCRYLPAGNVVSVAMR